MEVEKKLKILSQNMNVHHFVAHSYYSREDRIAGMLKIIPEFDIVCLQEIFTFNLFGYGLDYRERIISTWNSHHAVSETAPWLQQGKLSDILLCVQPPDTGLMILSKHKILSTKTVFYDDRNPLEYFSKKGMINVSSLLNLNQQGGLIAKIDTGNSVVNVVTTHLDAHVPEVRVRQLTQLMQVLKDTIDLEKEKIILLGDINIHAGYVLMLSLFFLMRSDNGANEEFLNLQKVVSPLQDVRKLGGI
jgi:endonuclease/exonuclease/phosphatase family metal-dependent hydrolase